MTIIFFNRSIYESVICEIVLEVRERLWIVKMDTIPQTTAEWY